MSIDFSGFQCDSNPTQSQVSLVFKHETILIVDALQTFVLNNVNNNDNKCTVVLIAEKYTTLTYKETDVSKQQDGVVYTVYKSSNVTLTGFPSCCKVIDLTDELFIEHVKPRFKNDEGGYSPNWINNIRYTIHSGWNLIIYTSDTSSHYDRIFAFDNKTKQYMVASPADMGKPVFAVAKN